MMANIARWRAILVVGILGGLLPWVTLAAPSPMLDDGRGGDYQLIRVGAGGDYAQLGAALAAAPPGMVIEVLPGVQQGQWTIDRPLVLRGRHGAVLDGGEAGSTLTITAPGVTVQGLSFQRSGLKPIDAAILVRAAAVMISGNRFERFVRGVVVDNGANVMVTNNTFIGALDDMPRERSIGIALLNAPSVRVELNTILAVQIGIAIDNAPRGAVRGNVVSRSEAGIVSPLIAGAATILGVTATFFSAALCLPSASDVLIDRNTLTENVTGIKLAGSARVTVQGNLIEGQRGDGLLVHNSAGLIVQDNRFERNARAITVGGSGALTAQRNRFDNHETVLALLAGDAAVTLRGNDIVRYRVLLASEPQAPAVVWAGNYWQRGWPADWWQGMQLWWHDRNRDGFADQPLMFDGVIDQYPALRPNIGVQPASMPATNPALWLVALVAGGLLAGVLIRQRKG